MLISYFLLLLVLECTSLISILPQEKQLCREIRLAPPQYLKMQEIMSTQIFNGNITKRSDAYSFFQIEPTKVDRVYDMLLKKGITGAL